MTMTETTLAFRAYRIGMAYGSTHEDLPVNIVQDAIEQVGLPLDANDPVASQCASALVQGFLDARRHRAVLHTY
jgi:hypothetical protein